jgi:hypothetical protein
MFFLTHCIIAVMYYFTAEQFSKIHCFILLCHHYSTVQKIHVWESIKNKYATFGTPMSQKVATWLCCTTTFGSSGGVKASRKHLNLPEKFHEYFLLHVFTSSQWQTHNNSQRSITTAACPELETDEKMHRKKMILMPSNCRDPHMPKLLCHLLM